MHDDPGPLRFAATTTSPPLCCLLAGVALCLLLGSCGNSDTGKDQVILYSSVDEIYSLEVCKLFEKRSGVRVKLVSDTEVAKSAGLVSRLIAEKDRPVADVFWSGDLMRALQLQSRQITESYVPSDSSKPLGRGVSDFGGCPVSAARLRMIVFNKEIVKGSVTMPRGIEELASPAFASRTCLANPMFGTTSMHAAALYVKWGEVRATAFFKNFAANGGRVLASNGEVRRRVVSGEFMFGITDSDDISVALADNKPVGFIMPDQEGDGAVLIPSSAVLIKGAPHGDKAKQLVDFLNSAELENFMAESTAAHFPVRLDLKPPKPFDLRLDQVRLMEVDYSKLATEAAAWQDGFLRQWVEDQHR